LSAGQAGALAFLFAFTLASIDHLPLWSAPTAAPDQTFRKLVKQLNQRALDARVVQRTDVVPVRSHDAIPGSFISASTR